MEKNNWLTVHTKHVDLKELQHKLVDKESPMIMIQKVK